MKIPFNKKMAIATATAVALFAVAILIITLFSKSDPTTLDPQVKKLWQARINKDMKTIYSILDTKYKSTISEEKFTKKNDYQVLGEYEVVKTEFSDDKKLAKVFVKYKTINMGYKLEPTIMENWIFENGEWHVGYSMRRNPFMPKKENE